MLAIAVLYLLIHIIFREPDITTLSTYINNFTIVVYVILILFAVYVLYYIKNNKFKLLELVIMFSIISIMILPNIYNIGKNRYLKIKEINEGKNIINKYLMQYFDEEDYKILYDGYRWAFLADGTYYYEVESKIMDFKFRIGLNEYTLDIEENTFIDIFLEKNNIERYSALNTYLKTLGVLPLSVNAKADVVEINFNKMNDDFSKLNILNNLVYDFDCFYIQLDKLEKNEIIDLSKELFNIYKEYIYKDNLEDDVIKFYVQRDNVSYAYGEIKENFDNVLILDFRTYNNSEIDLKFNEVIMNVE